MKRIARLGLPLLAWWLAPLAAAAADLPSDEIPGLCYAAPVAPGVQNIAYTTAAARPLNPACQLTVTAYALVGEDRTEDAEKDWQQALALSPNDAVRGFVRKWASRAYSQRAIAFADAENWERVVASYTAALRYVPDDEGAYSGRAEAHYRNVELDEAQSDYTAAIHLTDDAPDLYISRGGVLEAKLDFQAAIADYSKAIELDPSNNVPVVFRGRAHAILGEYAAATADLEHGLSLTPDASTLLWLHIVHMRSGVDDIAWLRQGVSGRQLVHWPSPVLAYFLGDRTTDDIIQVALTSAETAQRHQRCDAWFYLGEEARARGDAGGARDLLNKTVNGCNAVDYEWDAAKYELEHLP